jgi:hypothetical protein
MEGRLISPPYLPIVNSSYYAFHGELLQFLYPYPQAMRNVRG